MVQDADASDDFLDELDAILEATFQGVSGVADNGAAFGSALRTLDSSDFTVFHQNLTHVSVEHECATIDSADS